MTTSYNIAPEEWDIPRIKKWLEKYRPDWELAEERTKKLWGEERRYKTPYECHLVIRCDKGHYWETATIAGLKQGHGCPKCRTWKSEKLMVAMVEKIFVKSSTIQVEGLHGAQIDFKKAYGISYKRSGGLTFDYYFQKVEIKVGPNKWLSFSLAFEYDGIQHDKFTKAFHETEQDFLDQQEMDQRKDRIALEKGTIVIRIGKHDSKGGCDFKTAQKMLQALFEKIESAMSVDLSGRFKHLDKSQHDFLWWMNELRGEGHDDDDMGPFQKRIDDQYD